ncbi:hypothetical protein LCER1_G005282 [Lachnellula cervina]|uniref:Reticulocyte-binding protein 2-like n=1 Tax=Lachnellula cervina TaxID=1316786 RepID=A0A7D8URF1_9HELO|nr:hypothetical protein LCER1_G005282 [Lachnellula cervina]
MFIPIIAFSALVSHLSIACAAVVTPVGGVPLRVSDAAALTTSIPQPYNDPYDANEPVTPIPAQRQQQRPVRRTHIEAASAGISPPPQLRFAQHQRSEQELTNDFDEDLATSTPVASSSLHHSPQSERRPHRALRISKNTSSAILFTLEEALRHPHPFTPDLVEENAQMSDLTGGGPLAPAGNGRGNHGGFRGQDVPGTGSPSGIKGPSVIMRERQAREARKRAAQEEKEAMERARADEEAMIIQETNRRNAERRVAAAGAAPQRGSGEGGQRGSGGTTGQRISDNSQRSDRRSGDRVVSGGEPGRQQEQSLQGVGRGGRAVGGGEASASARPRPTQSQQPRPVQPEQQRPRPAQPQAGSSAAGPSNAPPGESSGAQQTRSSFPHAFERWETLSAHWEGLTSYWIRRLQENSREIDSDPLSQQLSRQVTDLSAAGANLFHAVVELQRLRASSERKFQRWFFETRADIERGQEIQAMLEGSLTTERQERGAAIETAVQQERDRLNLDKQLADMKRELAISKEEAKRAWEELGRREEAERAKIASLRDGQPTSIGGVQVVPMMQGVPTRQDSARDIPPTRDGPYTGAPIPANEPEGPLDSDTAYQAYSQAQRAEPADPFVEQSASRTSRAAEPQVTSPVTSYEGYSQAPAVQPASSSAFYQQHQGTSLHPSERDPTYDQSVTSEGAFSEGEYQIDERGQWILDARGRKIPYAVPGSDEDTDEYDEEQQELASRQQYPPISTGVEYGRGSTATSGGALAPSSMPATSGVDYSGAGYGSEPTATEWSGVPRHHHPTRLSDVMEEDERSRTSASQISRRD